jgi:RNA polymerase sigma-70 factor (ECF subfamily)
MNGWSDSRTSASLLGRLSTDPGDAGAWEQFVHRYGPRILQWCLHGGMQDADAQDITQNVLLMVARQIRTFRYDPERSFRGWLKAVTRGAWSKWLEGQRRTVQGSGDSAILDRLATQEAGDDLERRLEEEYERELLESASARVRLRVDPQTWEAFRLLAIEGLSGADAAERLGMKVGAVFVAKSRVQKMLQETIRTLENEEPA